MPNWCENQLRVRGRREELERFARQTIDYPATWAADTKSIKGKHFCLNALVPIPDEVIRQDDGNRWCTLNWGTKWDVSPDNIAYDNFIWSEGGECLCICFLTAWMPPEKWLATVCDRFPTLDFTLHYEEANALLVGDIVAYKGVCEDNRYADRDAKCYFAD